MHPFRAFRFAGLVVALAVVTSTSVGLNMTPIASGNEPTAKVSFELDVQPILTKTGCNTGACHGKQRGQNGFQLSLLAFDSDFDHKAITREARGRRIFPAVPEKSLLLEKAIGIRPHGGGKRFEKDSDEYRLLLSWIEQGSKRNTPGEPVLEAITLAQSDFAVLPNQKLSLSLTARFSDGTERDVTHTATYLSNETPVAKVDEVGFVTAGPLPGETAIMVRYMNLIAVANVIITPKERPHASDYNSLQRFNFVDELIYGKLQKAGVLPSAPIDDATFLRRAYTDIIGRLPTSDEARIFLQSRDPNKRVYEVEDLLKKPEYVDHWANQWADLLRPNPYRVGIKAVLNYDNWIREQFRQDVPYDEFVRRLVTAKGSTWRNGAVTLYRDRRSPDEMATLVSQLFLGIRLECAKCHHHPFERWSQRDFYQFAAFFSDVKHKGTGLSPPISGGEETIYVSKGRSVLHPTTGEALQARPLFDTEQNVDDVNEATDLRDTLAEWMTSKGNDYFAAVQVNRIWATLMGRGLVEPVDDLRSTNPATNPELLAALSDEFASSGFDQKQLIKSIVLSNAYATSSVPNGTNSGDRVNYSRHYRHRLRAEVLLDSVAQITETPYSTRGLPKESRSNQIWTHRVDSMFLDTFGRPDENQDPPCERTSDSAVTQALHLMNSRELDGRIRSDSSRAARLAKSTHSADEIVEELYLAIYSRFPSDAERSYAAKLIQEDEKVINRSAIEDLMWAMLNTPEFIIQN